MSNLEIEKKNKIDLFSFIKKYKILFIIGAFIILFLIAFNMGNSAAMVELEKEKVSYDELVSRIADRELELTSKNKTLDGLEKDLFTKTEELTSAEKQVDEKRDIIEEATAIVNDKENKLNEIKELQSQISSKEAELNQLNSDIKTKETKLASVTGQIQEKEDAPKTLSAGNFMVGNDLPASRYKAVPAGGSGNFVVYSSGGNLKVNTILGGKYGEPEYIFYAEEGDMIELSTSAKFIPVE
jgi:peptidoglycan hydrolase CwlO-like protein